MDFDDVIQTYPPVNADIHADLDGNMLQMAMEAAIDRPLEEKYADDPDDFEGGEFGIYALRNADFKNAVHLLKKIEREDTHNEYKDARFWRMLGRSCAKLWSTDYAKESYEKAITFEENALNPAIWHEMAQVYIDYGAVAGAAQLLQRL